MAYITARTNLTKAQVMVAGYVGFVAVFAEAMRVLVGA